MKMYVCYNTVVAISPLSMFMVNVVLLLSQNLTIYYSCQDKHFEALLTSFAEFTCTFTPILNTHNTDVRD